MLLLSNIYVKCYANNGPAVNNLRFMLSHDPTDFKILGRLIIQERWDLINMTSIVLFVLVVVNML